MRGQEVLRARIDRGLARLQLGIALHRGQEARRAVGIEMGARRNADADAVRLEFLGAREARHRQLGLGQRQRGEIGIVAHVGDDAGDDRGLARLVLADRGVLGQHMRHLVAQHRGQFRGVAGERDQAARHIELAGRQRERVHRARIEDRHLVGLIGTIGGRHQPVDGLADQGFELRIVIGAAIGGQDALMLAFGGRASARPCGWAWPGVAARGRGLKPADIAAGGKHEACAQQNGRSPKAGGSSLPSRRPANYPPRQLLFLYLSGRPGSRSLPGPTSLVPQHFDLPHPEHFNSRPATRLDQAPDTNPLVFERLRHNARRLESRQRAP